MIENQVPKFNFIHKIEFGPGLITDRVPITDWDLE